MNRIKISVMLTYYNQIEYIDECLKSILSQKCSFDFEILIGDDGSTDGTFERSKEYEQAYPQLIHVYRQPRDNSVKYDAIDRVSANRLELLRHAEGEYVVFLDGDDYFTDINKLDIQVKLLDKNQDCDMCGHPVEMTYEDPKLNSVICKISNRELKITEGVYWSYCWLHADSFVYRNKYRDRRADIEKINGSFFDDNTITTSFFNGGEILYIPNCMVAYRQLANSSWNSRSDLHKALVNLRVYDEYKRSIHKHLMANYIRHYFSLQQVYTDKNSKEWEDIRIPYNDSYVSKARKYREMNLISKLIFNAEYFVPLHITVFIKVYKKIIYRYCLKN